MYQPTVKFVKNYGRPDSHELATPSKIVLIWGDCRDDEYAKYNIRSHDGTEYAKPYVVSEMEEIKIGDYRYDSTHQTIGLCYTLEEQEFYKQNSTRFHKVLVLPDGIDSTSLLQIKNGSLKEDTPIMLKCEEVFMGDNYTVYSDEYDQVVIYQVDKEEVVVDGVIHYNDNGEWTPYTPEDLSQRILDLENTFLRRENENDFEWMSRVVYSNTAHLTVKD